ncbi:import inner membrane translocase subunit tim23-related [Anaeramoeba ignava]|uniref:Import inner membrane translocase subunit tim23-related n=1 Tax=Anaeramoeba ignava TaxID=1746090 RepID=A0A9Q0LQL4_ANAIG|nr:import inner membrane translocase subunit tim23-related [Anaeramoeba ignava]
MKSNLKNKDKDEKEKEKDTHFVTKKLGFLIPKPMNYYSTPQIEKSSSPFSTFKNIAYRPNERYYGVGIGYGGLSINPNEIFANIGWGYLIGIGTGAIIGGIKSIGKLGEMNQKVGVNYFLNSVTEHSLILSNRFAGMAGMYYIFTGFLFYLRQQDDMLNHVLAGAATGLTFNSHGNRPHNFLFSGLTGAAVGYLIASLHKKKNPFFPFIAKNSKNPKNSKN